MSRSKYDYDLIVIGGGYGGLVSSKLAAGFGKKVLLVEKNKIGDESCFAGWISSKALVRAGRAFHDIKKLQRFGINGSGKYDISNAASYVKSVINKVAKVHESDASEIKTKFGLSEFVDNHTIKINGKNITAKKFIIATGSSPLLPELEGLDKIKYLTNNTFYEQKKLPSSLIILGGCSIGIEFAQALTRLGIKTTLVERNERILVKHDKELVFILQERLKKEGLKILLESKVVKVEKSNTKINLILEGADETRQKINADALFIITERSPNTEGLCLEKAGVIYNNRAIVVDEYLKTTAPNIYACGDVIGPYQFSYMTEYQAVIAATNVCLPFTKKADYSNVLCVTFSDPEFAHAGLTEEQARDKYGEKIKIYKYEYNRLDRAIIDSAEEGAAKFIIDKKGNLLGAHILGHNAGDIIHEVQMLKSMKMKFADIKNIIHAYPTYSGIIHNMGKRVYMDVQRRNPIVKLLKRFKNIK